MNGGRGWNGLWGSFLPEEYHGFVNSTISGCFSLFVPKFWEVAGIYESPFCLKMNAAWVVVIIWGGQDTEMLSISTNSCKYSYSEGGTKNITLNTSATSASAQIMCRHMHAWMSNLHNLWLAWVAGFEKVQESVFPAKFWWYHQVTWSEESPPFQNFSH